MPTVTGIATSFIDFTRASNATVTDSDGKVKWAPHNLLTNSESFDAASWAKTSVTPTANSIAAPNGTTTADTLAASGANGTTLQTFTAEAISYTFAVWLKRKTGTGNIQIAADSGTYTTVTITSDWALYTVTQTPAAGSKSAGIRIVTNADEVYAWGAHLYRSDLGGMQANTSAYPMYNPTTPKNLVGYTEDFNTGWTKQSVAIDSTGVLAPNGLQTSDLMYPSTTGTSRSVYQASSGKTVSVYAKAAGKSYIAFVDTTGGAIAAWFNLSTGVKGTAIAGYEHDMVDEGDGWYRCWMRRTSGASFTYAQIYVTDADNSISVTANGTDGIYIWGAQLSDSASLDSYVPVYGAAVTSAAYYGPRRDFDGATLACKGLLVEEQRVNLMTHSNDMTQSIWTAYSSALATTANSALGPDGQMSANTITLSAAVRVNPFSVTPSTTYTISVWLRTDTGTKNITIGDINEVLSASTTVSVDTTWRRYAHTFTKSAGNSSAYVGIAQLIGTSPSTSGTVYAWGWQCDSVSGGNAPFATSYIPTGSASATRNADVASVSTQAFPYSATEGTLVVNAQRTAVGTSRIAQLDSTDNDRIQLAYATSNINYAVVVGGSAVANITDTFSLTVKAAAAYKANDFAASFNGGTVLTDTSGSLPPVTTLRIGSGEGGFSPLNGWIRQITYLPRRVSNAELVTRST